MNANRRDFAMYLSFWQTHDPRLSLAGWDPVPRVLRRLRIFESSPIIASQISGACIADHVNRDHGSLLDEHGLPDMNYIHLFRVLSVSLLLPNENHSDILAVDHQPEFITFFRLLVVLATFCVTVSRALIRQLADFASNLRQGASNRSLTPADLDLSERHTTKTVLLYAVCCMLQLFVLFIIFTFSQADPVSEPSESRQNAEPTREM
jgi:hypothetical protein